MHSCASENASILKGINSETWDGDKLIAFQSDYLQLMSQIVEICGFDPKATSAIEMH